MLDFAPQLIAVYGPNRERLYANSVALNYAGLSIDEWRQTEARGAFIHPDDREQELAYFAVLSLTVRLASWNCDYAQAMEVIVGFWLVTTRCATTTDRSWRWHVSCTDIEDQKGLRKGYNRKTPLSVKRLMNFDV